MHGAVFFEGRAHLGDVETDEVSDLDVGDFPLRLHLTEPAQGRTALVVKEEFEQTFSADELR